MPRTRFDRLKYKPVRRDPIKGLIVEYMINENMSGAELAARSGVSRATVSRRLSEHSDEWAWKEIIGFCKVLSIPPEVLASVINY